jgi:hypothetical protein
MRIAGLLVAAMLCTASTAGSQSQEEVEAAACEVVRQALAEYHNIKLGTKRKDVEKYFAHDGGIHSPTTARFVSPVCITVKFDADFDVPITRERPRASPDDLVKAVSQLAIWYMGSPVRDPHPEFDPGRRPAFPDGNEPVDRSGGIRIEVPAPPPELVQHKRLACSVLQRVIDDAVRIKPGMARQAVEQHFNRDGRFANPARGRYTHPACGYIKIDIEYDVSPVLPVFSPNDVVKSVSKPFVRDLVTD